MRNIASLVLNFSTLLGGTVTDFLPINGRTLRVKNSNVSFRRSFLIAGLLAFAVLAAFAEPADCGTNLQWEFDSSTGQLTFTSPDPTQRATMSYGEVVPWAAHSAAITSVVLPDSLTNIALMAFSGCTALTTVALPDSLTTVGMWAFNGCTALENVSLGNVDTIATAAFYGCTRLEAISLPASLDSIDSYAFYGCTSLALIDCLPVTPPALSGNDVFAGCAKNFKICVPAGSVAIYRSENNNWGRYYSAQISDCTSPPTELEETIVNRKSSNRKFMKDGHLFILHDGKIYNAQGGME